MNTKKFVIACFLALLPTMAMSARIVSMPTDSVGGSTEPFRHNLFHDATIGGGGTNGNLLAWFDLDGGSVSTWNQATGMLDLHVNIFADAAQTVFLGTGHATSNSLFGAGFGQFDDISLGLIDWSFTGAAAALLGPAITMDFIDHNYNSPNSAGDIPNTWIGNTVTLWGADGTHNGTGQFPDATLGVDMVFIVPEPSILLLMAIGLLGFGATVRRR